MNEETAASPPTVVAAKLGQWITEGARSACFMRPDFSGLLPSPGLLAALLGLSLLMALGFQRVAVNGAAHFYWQALAGGWLGTLLSLWVCWLASNSRVDQPAVPVQGAGPRPGAATLFGVLLAQQLAIGLMVWLPYLTLSQGGARTDVPWVQWLLWGFFPLTLAWTFGAGLRLLWPQVGRQALARAAIVGVLLASAIVSAIVPPTPFWVADESASRSASARPRLQLTQELFETQAELFAAQTQSLRPRRNGAVNLYAITFAPYEGEDVFLRESRLVAELMRSRFDAEGRVIQLVNHAQTSAELPWATPLNLQRAIARVAAVMNREHDILFIHLTSHGARDGKLAANFWPLGVESVDAGLLKRWLDEAGVRHRVISVSACYSGTWIGPFSDAGSLVMSASDAEHTSYGCGRKSELTYFGRAMYAEQLRDSLSFEAAHAAARGVIEQREREAGKDDGYSNPQIWVGADVRAQLAALERRLAAAPRREK